MPPAAIFFLMAVPFVDHDFEPDSVACRRDTPERCAPASHL
jgi:hypothetical protein